MDILMVTSSLGVTAVEVLDRGRNERQVKRVLTQLQPLEGNGHKVAVWSEDLKKVCWIPGDSFFELSQLLIREGANILGQKRLTGVIPEVFGAEEYVKNIPKKQRQRPTKSKA